MKIKHYKINDLWCCWVGINAALLLWIKPLEMDIIFTR